MIALAALAITLLGQTTDLEAADRLWVEFDMPTLSHDSVPAVVSYGLVDSKPVQRIGFTDPSGFPNNSYVIGSTVLQQTRNVKPATWDLRTVDVVTPPYSIFFSGPILEDTTLCAAIESDLAGHRAFSEGLLKKRAETNPRFLERRYSYCGLAVDLSLVAHAALEIEADLANELLQPDSDRADVLRRLKALDAKSLIKTTNYFGPKKLIESLEANLNTEHAATGTPEGAIDDLCEATGIELHGAETHEVDSKVTAIIKMGAEALPALYRHLHDVRLTRSLFGGEDRAPAQIITVGEACEELIHRITGKPFDGSSVGSR